MDKTQLFNQMLSYGLKKKKSKQDLFAAILSTGQFDIGTTANALKALDEFGLFEKQDAGNPYSSTIDLGDPQKNAQMVGAIAQVKQIGNLATELNTDITPWKARGRGVLEGIQSATGIKMPGVDTSSVEKTRVYESLINNVALVARALGHTGVLNDRDVESIKAMFPKPGDSSVETKMKLENVVEQFNSVAGQKVITLKDLMAPVSQGQNIQGMNVTGQTGSTAGMKATGTFTGLEREELKPVPFIGELEPLQQVQRAGEGQVLGAETVAGEAPGFREALEFAEKNPDDPRSKKLMEKLRDGTIDQTTGQIKGIISTQPIQDSTQAVAGTEQTQQQKTDTIGTLGKIGNTLGSFFGGNKIGGAIGDVIGGNMAKYGEAGETFKNTITSIEKMYQEGKIDENKRNIMLEAQEKAMRDAFGYNGPGLKELIGDTAKIALNVAGGAELGGAKFLVNVGKAALWGASYGTANAMTEDKKLNQIAKDALIGGAIGGTVPILGKVAGKVWRGISGKNTGAEALGEILQGRTKDLKSGERVLSVINRKGVKTYEDLGARVDDLIGFSARNVDDVLAKDATISKLDDLATIVKTTGGKEIKTNYVEKALNQLEELYAKIGDDVSVGNVQELIQKAKTQGLTKVEINQIARKYGMEFGDKAFNKVGDALTSVNAQMYENVRKGVKQVARQGITGQAAKELDSLMSDAFTVRDLVKKNIEAVNKLDQKAAKMGIGANIVRWATNVADTISLGGTKAARNIFIRSNVGKKTMNSFDIEQRLANNLKILQQANSAKTVGEFQAAIRKFNRATLNKIKNVRPGLNIQDVSKQSAKQYQQSLTNKTQVAEFQKGIDSKWWDRWNVASDEIKNKVTKAAKDSLAFDEFRKRFPKAPAEFLKEIFIKSRKS